MVEQRFELSVLIDDYARLVPRVIAGDAEALATVARYVGNRGVDVCRLDFPEAATQMKIIVLASMLKERPFFSQFLLLGKERATRGFTAMKTCYSDDVPVGIEEFIQLASRLPSEGSSK